MKTNVLNSATAEFKEAPSIPQRIHIREKSGHGGGEQNPNPQESAYLVAIQGLISNLYRHQKELARVLYVSEGAITAWKKGEDVPSPDNFYRLVNELHYVNVEGNPKLKDAVNEFWAMAKQPIEKVAGNLASHFKGCKTVSDYYMLSTEAGVKIYVSGLPPQLKQAVWEKFRVIASNLLEQLAVDEIPEAELCAYVRKGNFERAGR